MVKHYFSLEINEDNKLIKIAKILFGLVCILVAVFWIVLSFNAFQSNGALWITIIFLSGFGFYLVWSGIGNSKLFIEIGTDFLRIKKNPFLPALRINASELLKIKLYPLSIEFIFNSNKKILLRLGTTNYETNSRIFEEITNMADSQNITLDVEENNI